MGPLLFPVLAFVLWEFPSMVLMALHKAVCALTGGSFEAQFLGVWTYRIAGLFLYWPAVMITAGMAVGTGWSADLGQLLLTIAAVTTFSLLIWARVSGRGA
jgi:hypothetical protein